MLVKLFVTLVCASFLAPLPIVPLGSGCTTVQAGLGTVSPRTASSHLSDDLEVNWYVAEALCTHHCPAIDLRIDLDGEDELVLTSLARRAVDLRIDDHGPGQSTFSGIRHGNPHCMAPVILPRNFNSEQLRADLSSPEQL